MSTKRGRFEFKSQAERHLGNRGYCPHGLRWKWLVVPERYVARVFAGSAVAHGAEASCAASLVHYLLITTTIHVCLICYELSYCICRNEYAEQRLGVDFLPGNFNPAKMTSRDVIDVVLKPTKEPKGKGAVFEVIVTDGGTGEIAQRCAVRLAHFGD